jgi:hypothetical protein
MNKNVRVVLHQVENMIAQQEIDNRVATRTAPAQMAKIPSGADD